MYVYDTHFSILVTTINKFRMDQSIHSSIGYNFDFNDKLRIYKFNLKLSLFLNVHEYI